MKKRDNIFYIQKHSGNLQTCLAGDLRAQKAITVTIRCTKEGSPSHLSFHFSVYCLRVGTVSFTSYYPTAFKGCAGIVFTHGVRMGGVGRW